MRPCARQCKRAEAPRSHHVWCVLACPCAGDADREISARPTSPPQLSAIALHLFVARRSTSPLDHFHPRVELGSLLLRHHGFICPIAFFQRVCLFLFPFPGASSRRSNPVRFARDVTRIATRSQRLRIARVAPSQLRATRAIFAIDTPSPCRVSAVSGAPLAPTTTPSRTPAALAVGSAPPTTPEEVSSMPFRLFGLSLADLCANRPWSSRLFRRATPETRRR